ncbi:hypothetical protein PRIPAC_95854 [Pristionchus pacificus]|uniref:Ribosomal protein n=1 Tax=Pristionchus pacificus TaxID=54126 RepID=A0A2A6BJQ3_PRIPA|nr:hypothetical protein PRIPAC_95854 [Pristionchus pacificus]|eukprot:PDM66117.1 ribosomal protein [Pristionchus pacificus]
MVRDAPTLRGVDSRSSALIDSQSVKHNGNITFDALLKIARIMRPRSMAHKLEGTVLEILRIAQSIGCTVDDMHPHDLVDKIKDGELEIHAE